MLTLFIWEIYFHSFQVCEGGGQRNLIQVLQNQINGYLDDLVQHNCSNLTKVAAFSSKAPL